MNKEEYFKEIIRMMQEYWKYKKKELTLEEMKDNYLFMKHELNFVKKYTHSGKVEERE